SDHEARLQFLTWDRTQADIDASEHRARQAFLAKTAGASFHPSAYVAAEAAIFTEHLIMGEGSWIAGHALVRGDVELGAHTTVNPYAMISGKVRCGDGVRIASHVSIVGFNHGFDDPDVPIHTQKHESLGIVIGDDVWIGANAVVLDGVTVGKGAGIGAGGDVWSGARAVVRAGVTVGKGAVIAGGAVVSRGGPPLAIVGGIPARVVRYRGQGRKGDTVAVLGRLGTAAQAQLPEVLAVYREGEDYLSGEADGQLRRSARHLNDAIELAGGFGTLPEGLDVPATLERLQALQDPRTG